MFSKITLPLAIASCLLAAPAAAAELPFAPPSAITTTAQGATSVVAVDIDGDGDLDTLYASAGDDTVAWQENGGGSQPSWTTRTITTTALDVKSVVGADLDRDGDMDVVSASNGNDTIAWYESDGASPPSWTPRTITTSALGARSVVVADVDGDGDPDVLSASNNDSSVRWYENDGASPPVWTSHTISTTALAARSVFAADVDGDGDVDALSASLADNKIAWYENDGSSPPGWTARTVSTSAAGARSVHAADVDGDGDTDVLSASWFDNTVAWYESDGASPPAWTLRTITSTAADPVSVTAIDMDMDGDLDVLAASEDDDTVAWYENDGALPPAWVKRTISAVADGAHSAVGADVDGDGDLDVLAASSLGDTVAWHENRTIHRKALFEPTRTISVSEDGPESVHAADIDGDGDVDIVSGSINDSTIVWHENDGASPPNWTRHTVGSLAGWHVLAFDPDTDGDLDILSSDCGSFEWFQNDGTSNWTRHVIGLLQFSCDWMTAGDVDGDGDPDVIAAGALYENDGSPSNWIFHHLDEHDQSLMHDGQLVDMDNDGDLDVLYTHSTVWWMENDGTVPPFSSNRHPINEDSIVVGHFIRGADMDGDGDVDVVSQEIGIEDFFTVRIVWYEQPGWTRREITTQVGGGQIEVADVDNDGDNDVVATDSDKIEWYENDGATPPGWTIRVVAPAASIAWAVDAADIDDDGDIDVLSASSVGDLVVWHENNGGQFELATTDVTPVAICDDDATAILATTVVHNGRTGDPDAEWAELELLLEETAGDPLTSAEADALFDAVHVYHDDGSGQLELGSDTLVASLGLTLSAGRETVTFPDGGADVRISQGSSETYFVVADLTSDASSQSPGSFLISHVESGGVVEDREHDLALSQSSPTTVSSSVVNPSDGIIASVDLAGNKDDYETSNGDELASPSPGLILAGSPTMNFDDDSTNHSMSHTFDLSAVTGTIVGATLKFQARPSGSSANDVVVLRFVDETGTLLPGSTVWGRNLGPQANPGLQPVTWLPSNISTAYSPLGFTFDLDLTSLPRLDGGTDNVVDDMEALRFLDVTVSDDTEVDYYELTLITTSGTACAPVVGSGAVPSGGGDAPLTIAKESGGDITLSWSPSCAAGDDEYAIYEGTLGDFASHLPAECSLTGTTTHTMEPASESSYYLIVPSNGGVVEGSYGEDSDGTERPRSAAPCLFGQSITCQP